MENAAATGSVDSGVRNAAIHIARPDTIAEMVEQAGPAVVKIETYGTARTSASPFDDDFFRYFFGDGYRQPEGGQQQQPLGEGSGFIFDPEGYILTNQHVISDADEIYVTVLGEKERFKAELLGSDYDLDLAVLKIEGNGNFPYLQLGDSSAVKQGEWVTAIGNPMGFDHSVSVGVLSHFGREIQVPDQEHRRSAPV